MKEKGDCLHMYSIIDDIKNALRTASMVGNDLDKMNVRSVARGANEQSFQFPVLMDNTIPVDRATTLMPSLDRLYASWTQIYLSSIGFIDLNYIRNPKQFIAKYQPKFNLEDADDSFSESYDPNLQSIYGDDEMLFHESGESGDAAALITPTKSTPSLYKQMREDLKPHLSGYNLGGITGTKRSFTEDSKSDIINGAVDNYISNNVENRRQKGLSATRDVRGPKLTDMDAKKLNDMQPYALELRLMATKGDTALSQWVNYVVGVKAVLHPAKSDTLLQNLVYVLKNKNPMFNFIRWTTGEISLFKDIILHMEDINFDIANKRDKTGKFISSLKRIKKKYVKLSTSGISTIPPCTTIVISSDTYQMIKDQYGYDLKNMTFAGKIMDELFLMCFVILDDVTHTIDILVDGQHDFQTYSLDTLDREVTMRSNKLGKELTRMLGN